MGEAPRSEVENPEEESLRAVAEAHAAFLQEHLNAESLKQWGEAGMLENDGAGLLTSCLDSENYLAMSDGRRAQVDQLIESLKEFAETA
jgi:hypothetical protein